MQNLHLFASRSALCVLIASFLLLLAPLPLSHALDNGAALTPPRGVTTWELFNFDVSDVRLRALADSMVDRGLVAAGYTILWLDDGWPACSAWMGANGTSKCRVPAPRDADGRIVPDARKFPQGIAATFAYLHSRGLSVGIYTAPHAQTCGGYMGSLDNEALDASTFAAWGVDAVKLDAGCQTDCSLLNGCIAASLARMRDGLNATGRRMVFYVDDGNPTAGPRVYSPLARGWPVDAVTETHFARTWPQWVVNWGPSVANAFKIWFDRYDAWASLMDNVKQQVHLGWFQGPGAWLHPDQMTIGQGAFSAAEGRTEVFLYAVLAAPMFLSANVSSLSDEVVALVTNPEVLAVNSDADGTAATLVQNLYPSYAGANERWVVDVYVKPLADASFVFVGVNQDPAASRTVAIFFGDGADGSGTDIFPAGTGVHADIRDLGARKNLGRFARTWNVTLAPHDAFIVRVTPV